MQMKVIVCEAFVAAAGVAACIYGIFVMVHYAEMARAAKSYDQTHRCVATVMHAHLFWSSLMEPHYLSSCGIPATCSSVTVQDDQTTATLILSILNRTAAAAGGCYGVELGAQIAVNAQHLTRAQAQAVLATVIGQTGQYYVRYSGHHGTLFIYGANASAPAVGNALVPHMANPPPEHWKARQPLGAMLILIGISMIVCSVVVDTHRGGNALVVEFEQDGDDNEMINLRSSINA